MEEQGDQEHGDDQKQGSPREERSSVGKGGAANGPLVLSTNDSVVTNPGPSYNPDWAAHPDQTMAVETSRIRGPNEAINPYLIVVPAEFDRPGQGRASSGEGEKNVNKNGENAQQDQEGRKNQSESKQGRDDSGKKRDEHGHSPQGPSLTRILIYSGVVALVCGIVGAWGYSSFFGPRKSDDQKSSSKGSDSDKDKDQGSGKDSSSGGDADARKNSTSSEKDSESKKLLQAESAWLAVVKELHDSKSEEKDARHSDEETRAVLGFFRRTLFSAGHPGEVSLAEAFWKGGQGKDLTFRQAIDATESQVSDTFEDRPTAEATVREMLGQAYLSLGEATRAVKQYERAFALHQAMQGANHPDTAACRNQLAVAYRIAGLADDGGRLFDRNPDSPAYASALALRGSMLLVEKKPAEAELKLRECLTIRQKTQPDDWSTFDTKSLLGEALLVQKKYEKAEPLLVSGYEGLKRHESSIPGREKRRVDKARDRLVKLYESWGKSEEATKWRTEGEDLEPRASRLPSTPIPNARTGSPISPP